MKNDRKYGGLLSLFWDDSLCEKVMRLAEERAKKKGEIPKNPAPNKEVKNA